jgi:ABC-type amino acid transport substrate-binding protein
MNWKKKLKKISRRLAKKMVFRIALAALSLFILIWLLSSIFGGTIPERHTYHIAINKNFAPIQLFGKEPNLVAFLSDLISEILQTEKISANLYTMENGDLFLALDDGTYDGIIISGVPNTYLQGKYLFSEPFYRSGPVLVVPENSTITSLKELAGKPIGIQKGSSLLFELEKDRGSMLFISYDNVVAALDDLTTNVLSGVIMEMPLAYTYANSFYSGKVKVVTGPLTKLGVRLTAPKGPLGKHLIDNVNEGLEKLKKNGEYDKLIEKWELIQSSNSVQPASEP